MELELTISNSELSALIGDIYQGSVTGEWEPVLNQLIEITDSNKAFFFLQQFDTEQPLIMEYKACFDSPANALSDYHQRAMEDPGLEYTRFMTEGDWIYINKYMDVNQYKETAFYKEIYKPLKVFHAMAGLLCRDTSHESMIVINRDEDATAYSQAEENLFQLITPHFSRAMHIFKELRLYKNYSNISKSILDQQDKAILVCDPNGTVVIQNEYAIEQLTLPSPITLINSQIKIADPLYQQRFNYFIKQCATLAYKDIGLQETLVVEQQTGESMLVTVSPLLNQNTFNDIDVPCCLVTISQQQQINWLAVEREFELTPKELNLIKAIFKKQKLNDLVDVLGVSYNTLRTHLQSIFKKAQVNSQTELLIKLNMFS